MKKLSLIAGLACLATVGGVFGAWVYGSTSAQTKETEKMTLTVESGVINNTNATLAATCDVELHFAPNAALNPTSYTVSDADTSNNESATLTVTKQTTGKDVTYTVTAKVKVDGLSGYVVSEADISAGDPAVNENISTYTITDTAIVTAVQGMAVANGIDTAAKATAFITAVATASITIEFTVTEA